MKKSAKTLILTSLWPLWAKRNIPAINFTKAALFSKRYLSVMPYKYSGFFHSGKWLSLYLGRPASLLHQTPTERYSSMGWSLTSVSKVWTWVPLTLRECKRSIKVKHILKCILSSGNQISNTWYPSHAAFAVFEHKVRAGSHKHCLWKCDWVKLHTLDVKTLPSCCKWKGQEGVLLVCG